MPYFVLAVDRLRERHPQAEHEEGHASAEDAVTQGSQALGAAAGHQIVGGAHEVNGELGLAGNADTKCAARRIVPRARGGYPRRIPESRDPAVPGLCLWAQ